MASCCPMLLDAKRAILHNNEGVWNSLPRDSIWKDYFLVHPSKERGSQWECGMERVRSDHVTIWNLNHPLVAGWIHRKLGRMLSSLEPLGDFGRNDDSTSLDARKLFCGLIQVVAILVQFTQDVMTSRSVSSRGTGNFEKFDVWNNHWVKFSQWWQCFVSLSSWQWGGQINRPLSGKLLLLLWSCARGDGYTAYHNSHEIIDSKQKRVCFGRRWETGPCQTRSSLCVQRHYRWSCKKLLTRSTW